MMEFDQSRSLFLANASVNIIYSQLMLAKPRALLSIFRAPISKLAIGMVRYRGGLHLGYFILSIQGMLLGIKEKRMASLILGIAGLSQFCLDWSLVRQSHLYHLIPIAIIDAAMAAVNLAYFISNAKTRG
jgi:hypothetical protein